MKLVLLGLSILCMLGYTLFSYMHWPGDNYLIFGSILFFALGALFQVNKKKRDDKTLDEEFLDDV